MPSTQYINETTPNASYSSNTGYALDNSAAQAVDRFDALSELFDEGTIRHIEDLGAAKGWQCLEVGGGGGSIATWLSDRVGPSGKVVVTDINTRFLDTLNRPNLEVRRHNIVSDPLPEAAFDLVHARLVLMHLPERDAVLMRLIKALKPGGWLLDEEFDAAALMFAPDVNNDGSILKSYFAVSQVLTERGVDLSFGSSLYRRLRGFGLEQVGNRARLSMGNTESAEAKLFRSACDQLRDAMITGGHIAAEDIAHDLRRLDDPAFLVLTPTLWAAWGRRPSCS
jgi:SAM-dependent methyltransferase